VVCDRSGENRFLNDTFDAIHHNRWIRRTRGLKIKRILKNPTVTIQASNVRGRPKRGSVAFAGTAEVLEPAAVARVREAVRVKYRIMYRLLIERSDKKAAKQSGSVTAGTAAIKVVLQG
jgi:hypothetical protein